MEGNEAFKDISNFKTPKCPSSKFSSVFSSSSSPSPTPTPRFFTASKQTPFTPFSSSSRPRIPHHPKLKAFQIEQKTARKQQLLLKQRSLHSLSKSLTSWLNFLFLNPSSSSRCPPTTKTTTTTSPSPPPLAVALGGKREGGSVVGGWRCPKRMKGMKEQVPGPNNKRKALGDSLKEVCSVEELNRRMKAYLNSDSCKEVFDVMSRLLKNIDEGRLRMKPHCPIVTDVGVKEKAIRVLMSYNPFWLRTGLYIIFGGDLLLPDGDETSQLELTFLKMVIEDQFLSHAGLARAFAYNKMVDGLYRPGYYENLGNVILKRFLLLVLVLDRAKIQGALPLKYGLDGVDGGSPLLFLRESIIKSSAQMITDFLSTEVMHGEGNLLAHLVIIGYQISYQQLPLVEYDFKVKDLFVDLQDGVRLGRAVQLLLNDCSILMKMKVPSDTHKKHLANCGIVLKYLNHAGVTMHDEDGMVITEGDIAIGDKELTVSLLWNVFVHLQLPLLINSSTLADEIRKIRPTVEAVCEKYGYNVDSFSSMVDGKAIWCLLDYYFRKELLCPRSPEDSCESRGEESIMSATNYTDAVHNFILSQKLTTLFGNFPEVLQISDILECSGVASDRSVVVLLVFLSSQLIMMKAVDQMNFHKLLGCKCQNTVKRWSSSQRLPQNLPAGQEELDLLSTEGAAKTFKEIKAWWQEMAEKNNRSEKNPVSFTLLSNSTIKSNSHNQRDNAAKVIQSHFRRYIQCRNFLKMRRAVFFLQTALRAWLFVKQKFESHECINCTANGKLDQSEVERYARFIVQRHSFVQLRASVLLIQRVARCWINQRHQRGAMGCHLVAPSSVDAAIIIQKNFRCWAMRARYKESLLQNPSSTGPINDPSSLQGEINESQNSPEDIVSEDLHKHNLAATKIQCHFLAWMLRKKFLIKKQAIIKMQSNFRRLVRWRDFQHLKTATRSAVIVQSHVRRWIAQRSYSRKRHLICVLQRCFHVWTTRRKFLFQRAAATEIQSVVRCLSCLKAFHAHRHAAIEIQRFVRGQITRNRLLGAPQLGFSTSSYNINTSVGRHQCSELKLVSSSVLKLQLWWRAILLQKQRTRSAITLQSHFRGWVARKRMYKERQSVVVIQSCWRGYHTRKESRGQLLDLRLRIRKSAQNVDDTSVGCHQSSELKLVSSSVLKLQLWWRAILLQKRRTRSAIALQSHFRGWVARKRVFKERQSVVVIQSCWRGYHARKESKGQLLDFCLRIQKSAQNVDDTAMGCHQSSELKLVSSSVLKLQLWWRAILLQKRRTRSTIALQSHFRGWVARKRVYKERQSVVVIQSCWRGYHARKESREQLLDLRLRIQKSAQNVDDSMRIINRLIVALSELENMKSISGILHTCVTLDITTQHSQKCCEKLVAAGAIDSLLKLIRSVSRSMPDQEVLKHSLSTLRNLARYPHLIEVLIDSRGSIETLLWELLRNKEEGYFIASAVLKKICTNKKGLDAMRRLPALLKRLCSLVEELKRRAIIEKRNPRSVVARENTERRLKESVELLTLTTGKT